MKGKSKFLYPKQRNVNNSLVSQSVRSTEFRKYPKGVMVEASTKYPLLLFDIPLDLSCQMLYELLNQVGPVSRVQVAFDNQNSGKNLGYAMIKMGDFQFYNKLVSEQKVEIKHRGQLFTIRVEEQYSKIDLEVTEEKLSRRILRFFYLPMAITSEDIYSMVGTQNFSVKFLEIQSGETTKKAQIVFETVKACRECKSLLQANPDFPYKFQIESEYLRSVQQQCLQRFDDYVQKRESNSYKLLYQKPQGQSKIFANNKPNSKGNKETTQLSQQNLRGTKFPSNQLGSDEPKQLQNNKPEAKTSVG